MKKLTINDVARASLRTGKRAYLSLAIGIFLSIFLVTAICTCAQGLMAASKERSAQEVGYEDFVLFDDPSYTDAYLRETGMFDRIGRVYVTARAAEAVEYLGYYDEEGASLMNRRLWEGRMPEKAGEIAVERGFLETMRTDVAVGDVITIDLVAIDGLEETREYTLVGILRDQTDNLAISSYSNTTEGKLLVFPSMVVHEDEPGFRTGRVVLHRLMTISSYTTMYQVMSAWESKTAFYGMYSGQLYGFYTGLYMDTETAYLMTGLIMLGISLLTACGVGISQALEGRVAQRREEIGMLRAVGATRRQIRRIFGREAWLLALILAPVSVAAGCGFSFLASLFAPEMIAFVLDLRILLLVAVFSFLCILLSASLPLRRASHIMPMSVIRDVEILRKSRTVKAKKSFSAPRLISARQLRLHPTRQIGAAFLTMIMLICVIVGMNFALPEIYRTVSEGSAFSIGRPWVFVPLDFAGSMPRAKLTQQDIRQIETLDHVSAVTAAYSMQVNLAMEMNGEVPEYFEYGGGDNQHLYPDDWWYESANREYQVLREVLEVDANKGVAVYSLIVLDETQIRKLEKYVDGGKINLAAVNAGQEVIAYAPDIWLEISYDEEGRQSGYSSHTGDEPDVWNKRVVNDAFHAGQSLDIIQLFVYADEAAGLNQQEEDFERKVYESAYRAEASVTVGAVLSGGNISELSLDLGPGVITTFEGAEAMGVTVGAPYVSIDLDGEVDLETEKYLEERIEAIASRGEGTYVYNRMANYRDQQQMFRNMLLVFVCMTLVFFAVSVSIIAGNVGRRVRAESRMIGTLRAVGADVKAVAGCYVGQILLSVALGTVFALAGYGLFMFGVAESYTFRELSPYMPHTIGAVLLVAAGCFFFCRRSLDMSLRMVMKRSIIENIREL